MVEPAGAYCAAFSSTCASADAVSRGSRRTGVSGSTSTLEPVVAERALDLVARRGDDLATDAPSAARSATAPASMRAISRMFSNRRPSRSASLEDQVALLAQLSGVERRRLQVAGGDADRRERRPQVVRRATPAAPSSVPRRAARVRRPCARRAAPRARWRSPPPPASASSVPGSTGAAGRGQQADRLGADAQRHQAHRRARRPSSCDARSRCARGRRTRGRSCAPANASDSWLSVERDRQRPGLEQVPRRARAAARSRRRPGRSGAPPSAPAPSMRLAALGGEQHVAAEIEEPRQLVAPRQRFLACARAPRADRLLATRLTARNANSADPVLRIGDRQGADRRQEEEVEGQHRRHRRSPTATRNVEIAATTSTISRNVVETVAAFEIVEQRV